VPGQTGFLNISAKNLPAVIQNTGFEFTFTTKNIQSKNFNWTSNFNLTVPKNKLISFPGLSTSSYSFTYIEGQSLSVLYRYHFLKVDPATGIFQFEDVNKDGIINLSDYKVSGNLDPKYYGGLSNTFSYKNWGLDVFLEFRKQLGRNYLSTFTTLPPGGMANFPVTLLNRWQKAGDVTDIPQFTRTTSSPAYKAWTTFNASDGIFSDASFIRLKNIYLSYNISSKWLSHRIQSSRIYLQAQNLFTITGYKGSDPESQNLYRLSPLKTIVAGIRLNF